MIDRYDWPGGQEAVWRFGPDTGPVVALALPPFEEANRSRTFAVRLLRALARYGIGAMLPDLPGQGESLIPTRQATLRDWRSAFAAACGTTRRPVVAASIRAGALFDHDAYLAGRWQLAPQSGDRLVRELRRIGQNAAGAPVANDADVLKIAGNDISVTLLAELRDATPVVAEPVRVVRLGSDPAPADLRVDAVPLWRRTEPDDDPALAGRLADDLAAWTRACAGC